jgi:pimeloyl-ACP methyl ester carboxylesterase
MRVFLRGVLGAVVLLVIIGAVGAIWNYSVQARLLANNPPPGRFFPVEGKTMRLDCSGTGRPTIVAEAGSGEDALTWTLVQRLLEGKIRFCSYDRSGMGWSAPRDDRRDPATIARQLHTLLAAAGEAPPFVMLGHSLGGLYIRAFQQRYPSQVSALIFLDAVSPEVYEGAAGKALGLDRASRHMLNRFDPVDWAKEVSGYARLRHDCADVPTPLASIRRLYIADQCIASQDTEERREGLALDTGLTEISAGPVKVPALILSEDKSLRGPAPQAVAAWQKAQADLLNFAPQGYRVMAANSDHLLQIECSRFTADEIARFLRLDAARAPLAAGTTSVGPCR